MPLVSYLGGSRGDLRGALTSDLELTCLLGLQAAAGSGKTSARLPTITCRIHLLGKLGFQWVHIQGGSGDILILGHPGLGWQELAFGPGDTNPEMEQPEAFAPSVALTHLCTLCDMATDLGVLEGQG